MKVNDFIKKLEPYKEMELVPRLHLEVKSEVKEEV